MTPDEPLDPEECLHPNRPTTPREDAKPWHCRECDTVFVVTVNTELVWREL